MFRPRPAVVPSSRELMVYAGIVLAVMIWSAIAPTDRLTWFMEVIWVFLAVPLIALTWRRFPLTRLLCILIVLHMILLMVGGHYTYAKVPGGLWIQEWLQLERNHYDRLGHFAQGFIPAILARELLLRLTPLKRGGWLVYIVVSVCLAFSAFFEMLEWWAALVWGGDADAFLATQGDVWDTQWDMFLAMLGAMTALLLLSRWHDRQLGRAVS
jgi:putative membrane protein